MRASLLLSAMLHVVLLSVILLNFNMSSNSKPEIQQSVAIEIMKPSDFTEIAAGKPDAQPAAPAQQIAAKSEKSDQIPTAATLPPAKKISDKQAALPPPPAPQPASPQETEAAKKEKAEKQPPVKAEAEPEPVPVKTVKTETIEIERPEKRPERPKPRRSVEPPREAPQEAERQPEPRRQRPRQPDAIADMLNRPAPARHERSKEFDPNKIAALLNRDPTAGGQPPQEGPKEPWRPPSSLNEQAEEQERRYDREPEPRPEPQRHAYGDPTGRDARMTANDIDAFRAQISRCWTPPVGGLGGDAIQVKLRIRLNPDGTLVDQPEIVNGQGSPFFVPAADSAVRAVFQCQPYDMPREKYDQWRDMLLNFDPSRMYGG